MAGADWLCRAVGAGLMLAGLAGCAQRWTFAEPACPIPLPQSQALALAERPNATAAEGVPAAIPPAHGDGGLRAAAAAQARRAGDPRVSPLAGTVFEPPGAVLFDGADDGGMDIRPLVGGGDCQPIVRLPPVRDVSDEQIPAEAIGYACLTPPASSATAAEAIRLSSELPLLAEPSYGEQNGAAAGRSALLRSRLRRQVGAMWREAWNNARHDHRNYYSWITLRDLGLAVGLAAPLANTSLDEDFQSWYQRDVRSSGTDDFARFWKTFGEGQIFIPAFAGIAFAGGLLEGIPFCSPAGEYAGRVTRGYLVGAPPMLLMQVLLGASRPEEGAFGSRWQPFRDSNAVSGHAFVGAIPFITAAQMTRRPLLKAGFYLASTYPAFSRVNDNAHYLSQAALGWWMAWLACRAVSEPDLRARSVWFQPWSEADTVGICLLFRR